MSSSLVFSLAALVLFLLSPFPFRLVESSHSSLLTADKQALLSFKALVTDSTGSLSSWNGSSPCNWYGISCNSLGRRVSSLDLRGLGLTGSISPHIGNLSFLHFLHLQDNQFSGSLPDQLGNLSRLHTLNISSNLITGTIPLTLSQCSKLKILDLSANSISGTLPTQLELLSKLQILKLGQNQLVGTIPPSFGNMSSLTTLDLGTNSIGGPIPSELGHLTNLQQLQISINHLTGIVPPSLYNVSSLVTFVLASNNLWGEIPSDVGFKLPKLLVFHFCINAFTGRIPPSLHNVTKIQSIRMSHNLLVGSVPPGLGNLPDLNMYNIGYNQIISTGNSRLNHLITSLTNSTRLEFLAMDANLLEGFIPESVGNLSARLSKFYLGGNQIFGKIPASIGRLTGLSLLNMSHCSISGQIPTEISQLNNLRLLGMAGNLITGEIPAALGNVSKLTELELFSNELEGSIPPSFGNYQQLLSLDLSNNKLSGGIPKEVFSLTSLSSLLNLSKNHLSGPLPQEVGRLGNVDTIDISDNLLSGSIPDSIGSCLSLQELSMSNNSFSGLIPDTIGKLKALLSLDLSANQLSGSIANSIGDLHALQFLNLSFNNLEGDVPRTGIFRNLSRVHLEGNPKLCRSSVLCENGTHRRISKALRITIVAVCFASLSLLSALLWFFFVRERMVHQKNRSETMSKSFKGHHPMVTYDELVRATESFSSGNLLGTGSFGSVYRGVLREGMAVAIKVLNLGTRGASKSFVAECEALRNVRHRNLVKLVTSCSSLDFANTEFLALIYEFMGNGSLEDWIRGKRKHGDEHGLSVVERLHIALDVASAIDYLHNDCEAPVVHCDLKPSNVLLDEDLTAKVGDFGLARLLVESHGDYVSSSHRIKGSIGYIPPEYGYGGKPSTRGDVYSYGVMLLELLTGKSPTDIERFGGNLSLEKWVRTAFSTGRVMEVVDPELPIMDGAQCDGRVISKEEQVKCLVAMAKVALSCAIESPEARISMRDALAHLKDIQSKHIFSAQQKS